ncbi:hypothetical protein SAMN05444921_11983 [Streptomyces wuyuanensis]|uniref:Uncharacterized protein n=1 Tax=Streptomyces wuyuanensis TaxID=1196353 RepID=A0A1G9YQU6_9ACTN|nr:hypothetical protein SAMN05444921_11983 [Streptomyces wuyuanensis]
MRTDRREADAPDIERTPHQRQAGLPGRESPDLSHRT